MADLRDSLRHLLGIGEDRPADTPAPGPLPASTFLCPPGDGPFPAVLYCHAHGGQYKLGRRELTQGARWLAAPYAPDLTEAGFAVLSIDMPGFGDRRAEGPENALAKAGLWQGRPLFGRMIAEQRAALDWLTGQPRIDPARIATLGMSMGAALAFWTAALDPRVAACAHLCMLADIGPLIDSGTHDRHGHYLTVPGLLRHAEIGDVAALIAPRPQFVGLGAQDRFTPPEARDPAMRRLRAAYGNSDRLQTYLSPDTGHIETPEMRRAVLRFLHRACAPIPTRKRIPC